MELTPLAERADAAGPRDRLLAAAIEYAEANGLGELSLRDLAAAIGTSHRMLIYHFGSKEGLLVAIVRAVEEEQRRLFAELAADPSVGQIEAIQIMWERMADRTMWARERLYFEVYAQALQGRPGTAGFLDGLVESWISVTLEHAEPLGMLPASARADARLGIAVARGLLLDLLATGDRAAVDAAMGRFISACELAISAANTSAANTSAATPGAATPGAVDPGDPA